MNQLTEEAMVVEELAASLMNFVVESLDGISIDATTDAIKILGVLDGDEVKLPESFKNEAFAGEMIAEELLSRQELRDVLTVMATLLIKRIRLSE